MLQVSTESIERMLHAAAACERAGQLPEAERLYRQVLAVSPPRAEVYLDLGNCLKMWGRFAEAIECYTQALALRPEWAIALSNMGIALFQLRRIPEAIACWKRAVAAAPDFAEGYNNLGNGFKEEGRVEEAIEAYRQAITLQPGWLMPLDNLVAAVQESGRLEEALALAEQAVAAGPNSALHHNNIGIILKDLGEVDRAVPHLRRAVELDPADVRTHQNLLYTLQYHADSTPEALYREHILWNQRHAQHLMKNLPPHQNDRNPERRLRIGYVSPDFRYHPVSHFMLPLLKAHDHEKFEIICYSDVRRPDAMTEQMRKCSDLWGDITGYSDEQVANMIRADKVDVLIDLTMHMAYSRLMIFARKPAPVQATWLGYPGTTGLSAMDYRVSDAYMDPPGQGEEKWFSEETYRLPDSYWCYDPLTTAPQVNDLPAAKNGYITFGCLHNVCKVNDGVLRLWAEVLKRVENSRMLILASETRTQNWIREAFQREGVAGERVQFVVKRPRAEYLELYHQMDIGLDTFPYNGHTTSLDALWMGVPVVTMHGKTVVARGGVSVLTNVGLPEFIGKTPEEFVEIAARVAGDVVQLAALRGTLRRRLEGSALMDASRFARNIEAAYRFMWRRWCGK